MIRAAFLALGKGHLATNTVEEDEALAWAWDLYHFDLFSAGHEEGSREPPDAKESHGLVVGASVGTPIYPLSHEPPDTRQAVLHSSQKSSGLSGRLILACLVKRSK